MLDLLVAGAGNHEIAPAASDCPRRRATFAAVFEVIDRRVRTAMFVRHRSDALAAMDAEGVHGS